MLIAVTTPAYEIYEAYGVHCTTMSGTYPRRFETGEVERLGFVVRGTVRPLVPRIRQLVLSVPTRTSNLPTISRAGGDAHHVAEAIAEWRTRLGHAEDFARIFLLSEPDDGDTLHLTSTVSKAAGEPDVSGSEFVYAEDLSSSGSLGELRSRRAARATGPSAAQRSSTSGNERCRRGGTRKFWRCVVVSTELMPCWREPGSNCSRVPSGQHPVHRQPGAVEVVARRVEDHEVQARRGAGLRAVAGRVGGPGERVVHRVEVGPLRNGGALAVERRRRRRGRRAAAARPSGSPRCARSSRRCA